MNRIPKNTKVKIHSPLKLKIKKQDLINKNTVKSSSRLERTPTKDYYDYSTEDKGFFTRKNTEGKILEVIELIFPR